MNTKAYLANVHPVLPVWNVEKAIAFYVRKLGFTLAFKDTPDNPKYAGVCKDAVEIHLQWHDTQEWEVEIDRPMLRFVTLNIKELYEQYSYKDVFHEQTVLKETPWGTKEFAFYDPFKNGLTFYTDVSQV